MSQIITNRFEEVPEPGPLAVFQVGKDGFGQSEKAKKKGEYEKMKCVAISPHV